MKCYFIVTFHLFTDIDVEHPFMCCLVICISSFKRCLLRAFVYLKNISSLNLSCRNSLCILGTSLSSIAQFANIFSHSVDCLFTFSTVLFATAALILMKSVYLSFFLLLVLLVLYLGRLGLIQGHRGFLLRLTVLALASCPTFRSLVHLELRFARGVRAHLYASACGYLVVPVLFTLLNSPFIMFFSVTPGPSVLHGLMLTHGWLISGTFPCVACGSYPFLPQDLD